VIREKDFFSVKSQLAKLMAGENFLVDIENVKTPAFDLKNRRLILPNWVGIGPTLCDMFVGHEVSHALHTPAEEWKKAIDDRPKLKNYGSYLNLVEDARVDRLIQARYPGLRMSYLGGCRELLAHNFFGVQTKADTAHSSLGDRLNLFFKGQQALVDFKKSELWAITAMEQVTTFEEVIALAEKIYEQDKARMKELQDEMRIKANACDADGDESDAMYYDEAEESEEGFNDGDSNESIMQSNGGSESEEAKQDAEPTIQTQETFKNKLESFAYSKDVVFKEVPLPIANLENCLVTEKEILGLALEMIKVPTATDFYRKFQEEFSPMIDAMVNEFQRLKAARSYAEQKSAKSGEIDIAALYRYRALDENIFLKNIVVQKGKSHGVVILLDRSRSMSSKYADCVKQVLILASFCKKVQIPFEVYGFTNPTGLPGKIRSMEYWKNKNEISGYFRCHSFGLRKYLSSHTTAAEFAIQSYWLMNGHSITQHEAFRDTPLVESLLGMYQVIGNFRKKQHVDIAHLMIIQDGDSEHAINYNFGEEKIVPYWVDVNRNRHLLKYVGGLRDVSGHNPGLTAILNMIRETYQVNIYGLFISNRLKDLIGQWRSIEERRSEYRSASFEERREWRNRLRATAIQKTKLLKQNYFFDMPVEGYDRFNFVLISNKEVEERKALLEIENILKKTSTKNTLKKVFKLGQNINKQQTMIAKRIIPMMAKYAVNY